MDRHRLHLPHFTSLPLSTTVTLHPGLNTGNGDTDDLLANSCVITGRHEHTGFED